MHRFLRLNISVLCCKSPRFIVVSLWLIGLLIGFFIAQAGQVASAVPASMIIESDLCFLALLTALLVPLIVTYISILSNQTWLLYLTVFLKALQFSFVWIYLFSAFGVSAWLVSCFAMFGDFLSLLPICFLWLRTFSEDRQTIFSNVALVALLIVIISTLAYFFVAPFFESLI